MQRWTFGFSLKYETWPPGGGTIGWSPAICKGDSLHLLCCLPRLTPAPLLTPAFTLQALLCPVHLSVLVLPQTNHFTKCSPFY